MSPYAYLPMLTHLVCHHTPTYQSSTQWAAHLEHFVLLRQSAASDSECASSHGASSHGAVLHGLAPDQFVDWYVFSVVNRHSTLDYCRAAWTTSTRGLKYFNPTQRVLLADGSVASVHLGKTTMRATDEHKRSSLLCAGTHRLCWAVAEDEEQSGDGEVPLLAFTCSGREALAAAIRAALADAAVRVCNVPNSDAAGVSRRVHFYLPFHFMRIFLTI